MGKLKPTGRKDKRVMGKDGSPWELPDSPLHSPALQPPGSLFTCGHLAVYLGQYWCCTDVNKLLKAQSWSKGLCWQIATLLSAITPARGSSSSMFKPKVRSLPVALLKHLVLHTDWCSPGWLPTWGGGLALEERALGWFQPQLRPWFAVWPWASSLKSLTFYFLISKMGALIISTYNIIT